MTSAARTIAILLAAACLLGAGCDGQSSRAASDRRTPGTAASDVSEGAGDQPVARPVESDDAAPAESAKPLWQPGRLDISFDDIKFEMQKGGNFVRTMLTPRIEQLDGREVRIRGYMLPSFQQRGITQFVLVRDNLECCFGPGAALFDCILVEMEPGRSTSFTVRPVRVDGTFSVREFQGPDGKHLAIYHLSGRAVN